jgi:hypothetical protein
MFIIDTSGWKLLIRTCAVLYTLRICVGVSVYKSIRYGQRHLSKPCRRNYMFLK